LWQLAQLPGATPTWENWPPATDVVVPVGAGAVRPEVGAAVDPTPAGLPAGLTVRPLVGRGLALAAAAAAAAKPPVGLWQSMQSAVVELPAWLPIVLVLRLVPYHVAPLGAWQFTHRGVDDPELLVPLPRV
jgi:hypothetical protein